MKKKTKNNIRLPKSDGLNLPKSWEIKKLGEVCEIELGKTPYRKDNSFWDTEKQTNNVWLSISDLLNAEDKYIYDSKEYISDKGAKISKIVKKGTLLLSFKLTIGRLAFAGKDLFTNEAIAALSIKNEKEVNKEYLYHYLSFFDWDKATEGESKVKGRTLNKTKLKELDVIIPPLPEQKRIVALLDRIFSAIERSRNIAEQNLNNAKELFQSKLQEIFENGKLKMESGEWEEKKLGGLGKVQTGSTPPTKDKSNYGDYIPFAKPPHFKSNGDIETEESMLSKIGLKKGRLFDANSILMVCIGATIGKTGFSEKPISANQQINGLTPFQNYYARFFYYAFISDTIQKQILKQGKSAQATLPIINKTKWENILVSFPKSMQEQKQIVAQLDTLQAETKKLEAIYQQKIDNLDELKKSILQKAFRGEL